MAGEILCKVSCSNRMVTIGIIRNLLRPVYNRYTCQICSGPSINKILMNSFDMIQRKRFFSGINNGSLMKTTKVLKKHCHPRSLKIPYSHYAKIRSDIRLRSYCSSTEDNASVFDRYCDSLIEEHTELKSKAKTEILKKDDDMRLKYLSKRIELLLEIQAKRNEYADLIAMRTEYDSSKEDVQDMRKMVEEEIEDCQNKISDLRTELQEVMLPDDKTDHFNDVILEVNSAVGGQESMLFTTEIFKMYHQYALYKGWKFEINLERQDGGGLRFASASVSGEGVYRSLKFEAGVHRVQRIPVTEKGGRVHTSTMTVSVMPQPTEIDIEIKPKDLRIDTFRASGAGGQHVNTTDSAVRIIHLPTGMRVECQQERSQIQNRSIAMKRLRANLYQAQINEQLSKRQSQRKLQVGGAERSDKLRTYNYHQDRITDHRIHCTVYGITDFLSGGDLLDNFIQTLQDESKKEIFEEVLQEYVEKSKNKTQTKYVERNKNNVQALKG